MATTQQTRTRAELREAVKAAAKAFDEADFDDEHKRSAYTMGHRAAALNALKAAIHNAGRP